MTSPGEARRTTRRVPPLAVPRHRVVARVLATPPSGLCLVTTPPGYGGTTLMGLVEQAAAERTVWVDVRGGDGEDPVRFWHRLLDGLGAAGVEVGDAVQRLRGSGAVHQVAGDPVSVGERAVAEVLRAVSDAGPLLLLVDDLDTGTHAALAAQLLDVAEGQPSTCRMVVRTRRGSGLGLAHLVSSGRLVVLGARDLSLDDAEARELAGLLAPRLPADRRDSLVEVCDGWVTALVAALRVVASDPEEEPTAWLLGGGLDPLFDDELEHLGSEEAELLAATCVLDVLSPQVCDALRDRGDSHLLLGRLDASQTMLTRERGRGDTFRVHPLFAGYLRSRLQLVGPTALADAHRRAAEWFIGHGDVERAIGHQLEGGDVAAAMETLARHLAPLLDAGKAEQVRTWYNATGGPHVDQRHRHLLGAAWAEVIAGNLEGAEQQLHLVLDAVDHLSREGESAGVGTAASGTPAAEELEESSREWLVAEASLLRGLLEGWRGYPARSRESVERARRHYGDAWERMAHQSSAFLLVRTLLWSGRTPEAKELLTTAAQRPRTKDYYRQLAIPALRALVAAQEGRSHRSLALARQAAGALERVGPLGRFDGCDAALAQASAAVDLDQPDTADVAAEAVVARATEHGHVTYHVLGLLALVAARGARADLPGARLLLEEARLLLRTQAPGSDLVARVDAAELSLSLEAGEVERARALATRMPDGFQKEIALLRLARRPSEVVRLRGLRPLLPRQMVEQRLLLAASSVVARPAEADAHLLAAAEMAYELGLHRALVGWPEELHVAAERVARQHASEAMTRLLWVARAPRPAPVPPMAALSTGDHRLLDALVTARSNAELADDLGISVNTVKTRLRRLYAKLDVHGRDEAVRRAREAGILR